MLAMLFYTLMAADREQSTWIAQRDIAALIDRVIGDRKLPASVRQDIIERTDGIPLFVEEMTKAVLETTSEDEATRTTTLVPSSAVAVRSKSSARPESRPDRRFRPSMRPA